MEAGQLWRQYVIAGIANVAIACTGVAMGWTSPVLVRLKDEDTSDSPLPEPITSDDEAWIGSLLTVGAIFGPFIGGFLAARIGRKWSLLSSSIPLFIGWILIAAATNTGFLYAGRAIWGVAVGMIFAVSPMYCAEIATNEDRGALGSYLQVFVSVGFLVIYGVGPFLSYSAVAYVGVAIVAGFCICFYFMPESPIYYLTKNDREEAAQSLMMIRGRSRAGVEAELDLMGTDVSNAMAKTATIADVFKGGNFKAFYMTMALMFFQQFSGITAVLFYLTNIFDAAGSDLDSDISTIIIGAVQLGASLVTPFVVDRLGRRVMLMISTLGATIGLGLLGLFFLLDDLDSPAVESISFIPILSLIIFMVSYCVGLGPIPWAIMGELFPIEVKAIAAPIATAFYWTVSFFVTRYFGPVSDALGMYVAFWIFGACCALAFLFTLFVLPETKGKSFVEIQEILAGNKTKKVKEDNNA